MFQQLLTTLIKGFMTLMFTNFQPSPIMYLRRIYDSSVLLNRNASFLPLQRPFGALFFWRCGTTEVINKILLINWALFCKKEWQPASFVEKFHIKERLSLKCHPYRVHFSFLSSQSIVRACYNCNTATEIMSLTN